MDGEHGNGVPRAMHVTDAGPDCVRDTCRGRRSCIGAARSRSRLRRTCRLLCCCCRLRPPASKAEHRSVSIPYRQHATPEACRRVARSRGGQAATILASRVQYKMSTRCGGILALRHHTALSAVDSAQHCRAAASLQALVSVSQHRHRPPAAWAAKTESEVTAAAAGGGVPYRRRPDADAVSRAAATASPVHGRGGQQTVGGVQPRGPHRAMVCLMSNQEHQRHLRDKRGAERA